jgi:type II secretory pathway predicted ATPase ExeA
MRFCIGESLLGVITGEVGVGKTVALRAATSQLDQAAQQHRLPCQPGRRRQRALFRVLAQLDS